MDSVRIGADKAVTECQHQFRERRWNCTDLHKKRIFGKILNEGLYSQLKQFTIDLLPNNLDQFYVYS